MEITITVAVVTAIIIGLAEIAKKMGLSSKFIPLLDVVLGIGGAFLYSALYPQSLPYTIFLGIIMGLTACGLYSGGKNVVGLIKGE